MRGGNAARRGSRYTLKVVRIASLQPSVAVTLASLGRIDTLCAHTRYCLAAVPELAARHLPIVEDAWSFHTRPTSLAALVAARPDLVVASLPYQVESLAAILRSGLPTLSLAPRNLAAIFTDIRLLAAVTNAAAAGDRVLAEMDGALRRTRALADTASTRPIVYCEEWGKPLIHSQAWVAELVEAAGGRFLGTPGAHTTHEAVAAADPDVLVFAWCGAGNRVPLAKVIAQRGWEAVSAVRCDRVFCISDELLNTPAPTLLGGLAALASVIHPAIFASHREVVALSPHRAR